MMRTIRLWTLAASCMLFSYVSAQQNLTLKQATLQQWSTFRPQSIDFTQWKPSGKVLTAVKAFKTLEAYSPGNPMPTVLCTVDQLNDILKSNNYNTVKYFPYTYTWVTEDAFRFEYEGSYFTVDLTQKKVTATVAPKEGAENAEYAPTRDLVAYTISNNVHIAGQNRFFATASNDADLGIVNGSNYVHRQEFGIQKGMFWSPQSNFLAYYKKDERMVTNYPLVNMETRIAETKNIRYPMAGMTSEEVSLVIHNLQNNANVTLKIDGPKDQYITAVTWDQSEKFIYVGILNRGQNVLEVQQYDVLTGEKTATLFTEKHPKYVEPEHPFYTLKTRPTELIWQSERDGFNHLYLYATSGKLLRQLTSGNFEVTEILGTDPTESTLYVVITTINGMGRNIAKVNLKKGGIQPLTNDAGTHSAQLSPDGKWIFDQYTDLQTPNRVQWISTATGKATTISEAPNPFDGYTMPKAEMIQLTAADGVTQLNGRIIKPANFDPSKKYPVIVYVYGGPHAQLVTNTWLGGARLWEYYMAQQGYIMFTLDNRGSAHRGLNFENVIHRQLGQAEMADQMQGVTYLKSLPYVDSKRMGIHGWSFGGFMTTTLMTAQPDVFKVGVAGGPVIDWKFYEVMYGERYMDSPEENPDGYAKTALQDKCKNLKGRLMIIHGAQDNVVVMQHSYAFLRECITSEIPVDFFVYPQHEHNVSGKDRYHLMQKITDYFMTHL